MFLIAEQKKRISHLADAIHSALLDVAEWLVSSLPYFPNVTSYRIIPPPRTSDELRFTILPLDWLCSACLDRRPGFSSRWSHSNVREHSLVSYRYDPDWHHRGDWHEWLAVQWNPRRKQAYVLIRLLLDYLQAAISIRSKRTKKERIDSEDRGNKPLPVAVRSDRSMTRVWPLFVRFLITKQVNAVERRWFWWQWGYLKSRCRWIASRGSSGWIDVQFERIRVTLFSMGLFRLLFRCSQFGQQWTITTSMESPTRHWTDLVSCPLRRNFAPYTFDVCSCRCWICYTRALRLLLSSLLKPSFEV